MLDRIDLTVWTNPVDPETLADTQPGESSKAVRSRVNTARTMQRERFHGRPESCNAELTGDEVRSLTKPTADALATLQRVCEVHSLSARVWSRTLKVARTIADLAESERVHDTHILEASSYRLPSHTS